MRKFVPNEMLNDPLPHDMDEDGNKRIQRVPTLEELDRDLGRRRVKSLFRRRRDDENTLYDFRRRDSE